MRKYLTEYLEKLEALLRDGNQSLDYATLRERHLLMIQFMQHERLVHLLVMMLVALGFFITLGILLLSNELMMLPLAILLLALVVPYIIHYYFLENSVQKMYRLYDEINRRLDEEKSEKEN